MKEGLTSIELCAGAGGQALGLEQAGFQHSALVEIDEKACQTLRLNRPGWNVLQTDLKEFSGSNFKGIDLVGAGVPCPPFSVAGKQLGAHDDRNLFPEALRVVEEAQPNAILFENVKGLMTFKFQEYRQWIVKKTEDLGYLGAWKLFNAADFGVPQTRFRAIFVALKEDNYQYYSWPSPKRSKHMSVGNVLYPYMKQNGWTGAEAWSKKADTIGPTIVGGSKKHGGPDLGPTRAKESWRSLGVDGHGISNTAPEKDFSGMPKLTVEMAAILQGFPPSWRFAGAKTSAYRQVGNAFPPPIAKEIGVSISSALLGDLKKVEMVIEAQ